MLPYIHATEGWGQVVAGIARDYKHGVELGRAALQSGATRRLLDAYMEASRKYVPSPLLQGAEPSMPKVFLLYVHPHLIYLNDDWLRLFTYID